MRVTALPGCLLQIGDVFFSSASSPCLLKSQQLAEVQGSDIS